MDQEQLANYLKEKLGEELQIRSTSRKEGTSQRTCSKALWCHLPREDIHEAVDLIWRLKNSQLSVISGSDQGGVVELTYHMTHGWDLPEGETYIHLEVHLPKDDLIIDTITDITPGALFSEREKIEMLGITFKGLEDTRKAFLPENFRGDIHPWRRDEKGVPEELVNDLRPEGVHE